MKNTRLMDRLFSSTSEKDEELNQQVANDIEEAKKSGEVDTDELKFKDEGNGTVSILDKENGETTMAERAEDGNYELYPAEYNPTEQPEGFIHPAEDGVTPGNQQGAPDEHVENHLEGQGVAESNEPGNVEETAQMGPEATEETCPECGKEPCECGKKEDEEKSFCDSTNTVVQRIFSDQYFMERIFSEVIESEDTAKIGDLKIEKVDDNAVVVTDENSGDQAKVDLSDDEMEVTELDSKNFSEEGAEDYPEEYAPLHVVGVDSFNHVIVDAPEYDPESAQELAQQLTEDGVDAVQIFENEDEARDYAINLLTNLGAQHEDDIEEPQEAMYSDHTIYLTRYYSDHTYFMDKMFSEACCDVDASQAKIEDALENGDEIETETEIITPIDSKTAVIQDKENDGEYTKVVIENDNMNLTPLSEDEATDLMEDIEDQKEYSDLWCNEAETKFFSESENLTDYMVRLFSDEADEKEIEKAIETGEQINSGTDVITPVDDKTAVIEDTANNEFTKATMDDEKLDVTNITKEEANDLIGKPEETEEKPEEKKEEEEKTYSTGNPILDKFFADVMAGNAPADDIIPARIDPATGQLVPVEDPNAPAVDQPQMTVEAVEDKALAAVQSIQAAAAEAEATIMNAKAAPVENEQANLQEAQFSDKINEEAGTQKTFSNTEDTLVSWLKCH